MRYRLTWRDRAIPIGDIRDVRLDRHAYTRKGMGRDFYNLIIRTADGEQIVVQSFTTPEYENNLAKANDEIRRLIVSRGG